MQVQKLLFSATLSHDPEQLASLELVLPTLFVAEHGSDRDNRAAAGDGNDDHKEARDKATHSDDRVSDVMSLSLGGDGEGRYSTPATLSEHMVVCGAQHKPLVVLHFLLVQRFQRVLVFVSSREAAHR